MNNNLIRAVLIVLLFAGIVMDAASSYAANVKLIVCVRK